MVKLSSPPPFVEVQSFLDASPSPSTLSHLLESAASTKPADASDLATQRALREKNMLPVLDKLLPFVHVDDTHPHSIKDLIRAIALNDLDQVQSFFKDQESGKNGGTARLGLPIWSHLIAIGLPLFEDSHRHDITLRPFELAILFGSSETMIQFLLGPVLNPSSENFADCYDSIQTAISLALGHTQQGLDLMRHKPTSPFKPPLTSTNYAEQRHDILHAMAHLVSLPLLSEKNVLSVIHICKPILVGQPCKSLHDPLLDTMAQYAFLDGEILSTLNQRQYHTFSTNHTSRYLSQLIQSNRMHTAKLLLAHFPTHINLTSLTRPIPQQKDTPASASLDAFALDPWRVLAGYEPHSTDLSLQKINYNASALFEPSLRMLNAAVIRGNLPLAKKMLEHKADPFFKVTSPQLGSEIPFFAQLLCEKQPKHFEWVLSHLHKSHLKHIDKPFFVPTFGNLTPLSIAILMGDEFSSRLLINKGASIHRMEPFIYEQLKKRQPELCQKLYTSGPFSAFSRLSHAAYRFFNEPHLNPRDIYPRANTISAEDPPYFAMHRPKNNQEPFFCKRIARFEIPLHPLHPGYVLSQQNKSLAPTISASPAYSHPSTPTLTQAAPVWTEHTESPQTEQLFSNPTLEAALHHQDPLQLLATKRRLEQLQIPRGTLSDIELVFKLAHKLSITGALPAVSHDEGDLHRLWTKNIPAFIAKLEMIPIEDRYEEREADAFSTRTLLHSTFQMAFDHMKHMQSRALAAAVLGAGSEAAVIADSTGYALDQFDKLVTHKENQQLMSAPSPSSNRSASSGSSKPS